MSVIMFEILHSKCIALGEDATVNQQERLVDWCCTNFGSDHWGIVKDILGDHGLWEAYSDMSMRCGEMGIYA